MDVAVIDADLIGRKKHRFPNLACMKIAGYHKELGDNVELKTDYFFLGTYDKVYISKVFTDTTFPEDIEESNKIRIGGTGFYFDKATSLPDEIEHHKPDYNLYDSYIESTGGGQQFREYQDYSIGFLTRGCFRKCGFCVNQKYNSVFPHSPLSEFFDPSRKKICLLDDNFLGFSGWRKLLRELIDTGRQFKFKQGLDERLLTEEKCEMLFNAKYDGDYTFAFDNVEDYELIETKLKMIMKYKTKKNVKFYVLCGFKSVGADDIDNAFKRIELLFRYGCMPYIMRYQAPQNAPWKSSSFASMYTQLARWCNQPSMVKKLSFRQWACMECNSESAKRTMENFEKNFPEIARKYFDVKFEG